MNLSALVISALPLLGSASGKWEILPRDQLIIDNDFPLRGFMTFAFSYQNDIENLVAEAFPIEECGNPEAEPLSSSVVDVRILEDCAIFYGPPDQLSLVTSSDNEPPRCPEDPDQNYDIGVVEFVIPDVQSEVIFDSPFSDLLPGLSRCHPDQPEHLQCQEYGETCGRPDCHELDEELSEKDEFCLRVSYPMSNADADNHNKYLSYLDQRVTIQHNGGQGYGVFNFRASLGQVDTYGVVGDYQTGVELFGYTCDHAGTPGPPAPQGLKLGQDFTLCMPKTHQSANTGVAGITTVEVIRDVMCEGRSLIDSEGSSADGGMSTVKLVGGDMWKIRSVVVSRYFQRAQTDPNGNMFFSCSGGATISIQGNIQGNNNQGNNNQDSCRLQEEEVESGNFNVKFSLAVPEGGRADGLVASGVLPRASAVTTAAGVMAIAVALL